ncbi:MAG TPA: DUF4258 domain-containing protein [Candidatus Bathyarchaeia archaeon]|nr:DUF4258 domain-containing protein [Candidatus Bathyarchaeia archaeon]
MKNLQRSFKDALAFYERFGMPRENSVSGIVYEIRLRLKRRNVRHTFHALMEEMGERLTAQKVEDALMKGFELVEDYPDDPRGHSCLILGWVAGKPVHVVCAPHEEALMNSDCVCSF